MAQPPISIDRKRQPSLKKILKLNKGSKLFHENGAVVFLPFYSYYPDNLENILNLSKSVWKVFQKY